MLTLSAQKRDIFGKILKRARREGRLPAVVYGEKDPSTSLFIDAREFGQVIKKAGETSIISLKIEGEKDKDVLVHHIELDPVREVPIHVDFYAVNKDKEIIIKVPLEFTGVSPAVKELGGTLVKVLHELEVRTLPHTIPSRIEVDISKLVGLDSHITIGELPLPMGVVATHEVDEIVAGIAVAKEEVEETPIDISQIEVEKKGKKEEEAGEADSEEGGAKK